MIARHFQGGSLDAELRRMLGRGAGGTFKGHGRLARALFWAGRE
jgi:hypothetical protein